ncbi:FAD/FMN-containing dehydrogenase [Actinokineospora alba]|uniref:Delta(24)-sterol reductase n=1 Tax=Actinokineospora alba TaxID=504798 RepID=A0A1H0W5L6_9PSEU|nr:FAD-binding oxidoreductase [Actinokineospora alba]TDP70051.1 FAD/FMN-containing dehydrogenase [Actinokineospora alba]SDJ49092.1 FAD/FMN-containing dehydrogenase [Actinokineospora alba]SDP86042.1 FAD/FMN-containing dehydrogenase [Actinokineospora alba]
MTGATTSAGTAHQDRVERLRERFAALPPDSPIRLAKRTSNLFRDRSGAGTIDVADFTHVLSVDPEARTADVEGMVTYEQLVDATLPHGLMPLVVPQLKTITLGGAVTGLGIESSSFRNGMPHESVLELEVLTGDGQVVVARPDNEHRDLFHGFPNSYGTLGYALRLTIELEPVRPYVHVRHLRHRDAAGYFAELAEVCETRTHGGKPVDFVDGTVFGPDELYLTLGTFTDEAPYTSDYTWLDIYYRSIQGRTDDYLTVRDYLWRWDTDWFWCSAALGVQNRFVRRVLGRKRLRSDVYWKVVALERKLGVSARIDRWRGLPERETVVQDIEVPIDQAAAFLDFFHREIPINPVWVCPVRLRDKTQWPLYVMDPDSLYVNFGFWSSVPLDPGEPADTHNRLIEKTVTEMRGRKSLYSASFHEEDEFWSLYNGPAYRDLKTRYDPGARLLDLYDKCVRGR